MESSWKFEHGMRSNLTLADDAALLEKLDSASGKILASVDILRESLSALSQSSERTEITLDHLMNDLSVLSNTQFLEHRVYDDDVCSKDYQVQAKTKTKDEEEIAFLAALKFGFNAGLSLINECFNKVDIRPEDLDEIDDPTFQPEPVYEPKNPYAKRRLPVIIGSDAFRRCRYLGLAEDSKPSERRNSKTVAEPTSESTPLAIHPNPPAQPTCSSSASSTAASDNSGLFEPAANQLLTKTPVSTSEEFQANLNAKLASINASIRSPRTELSSVGEESKHVPSPPLSACSPRPDQVKKINGPVQSEPLINEGKTISERNFDPRFGEGPPPILDEDSESDDDLFGSIATKNLVKSSVKEVIDDKLKTRPLTSNIGYKGTRLFDDSDDDDDPGLFPILHAKVNERSIIDSMKTDKNVNPISGSERLIVNKERVDDSVKTKSANIFGDSDGNDDIFSRSSNEVQSTKKISGSFKQVGKSAASKLFDSSDDETDIFSSKARKIIDSIPQVMEKSSSKQGENSAVKRFSDEEKKAVDQQLDDTRKIENETMIIKPKIVPASEAGNALANVIRSSLARSEETCDDSRDIWGDVQDEVTTSESSNYTMDNSRVDDKGNESSNRESSSTPLSANEKQVNDTACNVQKTSNEISDVSNHIIFCAQKTRPKMPAGRRRPPTFSKKHLEPNLKTADGKLPIKSEESHLKASCSSVYDPNSGSKFLVSRTAISSKVKDARMSILDSDNEEEAEEDVNDLFSTNVIRKTKKEMNASRPIRPYVAVPIPRSKSIFDDDDLSDQDDIFATKNEMIKAINRQTFVALDENSGNKSNDQIIEAKKNVGNAAPTPVSVKTNPKLFDDSDSDLDIFK